MSASVAAPRRIGIGGYAYGLGADSVCIASYA